jgi:maltose/moltooligosaccharide transporter
MMSHPSSSPSTQARQESDSLHPVPPVTVEPVATSYHTVVSDSTPKKPAYAWSSVRLFMMVLGVAGIQFAWSLQIGLSSVITERLGADPFVQGLIWCAGPMSGLLVQPFVGAISDSIWVKNLGRRTPFVLFGVVIVAIAAHLLPQAEALSNVLPLQPIILAALFIWMIDIFVNTSQGPYRALIPDIVPDHQATVSNSWYNLAVGLGAVVSMGIPPVMAAFNKQLTIQEQCTLSGIVLVALVFISMLVTQEAKSWREKHGSESPVAELAAAHETHEKKNPFLVFLHADREVHKISLATFFIWLGLFSLFIDYAPYVIHHIYQVPDLASAELKPIVDQAQQYLNASAQTIATLPPQIAQGVSWLKTQQEASQTAQLGMMLFNLVSMICALPIGKLADRFGSKPVLTATLGIMAAGFAIAPFATTPEMVLVMAGMAGIAWGAIMSLPFTLLHPYLPKGYEASIFGIYNIFICLPQFVTALAISKWIESSPMVVPSGTTHQWWLAFAFGAVALVVAMGVVQWIKEKRLNTDAPAPAARAGH